MLKDLRKDASLSAVTAGVLVALVGYASSVAIVIQGLAAVGASPAQIASGLAMLGVGKAITGIGISWLTRQPISIAWTTPGLALLATMAPPAGGFAATVGAFILVGGLIAVTGLWQPLGRAVAAIPKPVANAMLAGILLKLCLAPVLAIPQMPVLAVAVLAVWLVVGRMSRLLAVPAAVVVALVAMAFDPAVQAAVAGSSLVPRFEFVWPAFTLEATINIAVPLFLVTMASQNIPGLAVLATFDYRPPIAPVLVSTGLMSGLTALCGAPTINLAAITAALCAGPEAHPDRKRRYVAALVGGLGYLLLAPLAAVATTFVITSSPVLIQAVAGLALIGAFGGALFNAVRDEDERLPALSTFLVTASGITIAGIGAAFWGLVAGVVVHLLYRSWRPPAA